MMRKQWLGAGIALVIAGGLAPAASASTSEEVMIPGNDAWSACVDPVNGTGLNGATSGGNGIRSAPQRGCTP